MQSNGRLQGVLSKVTVAPTSTGTGYSYCTQYPGRTTSTVLVVYSINVSPVIRRTVWQGSIAAALPV